MVKGKNIMKRALTLMLASIMLLSLAGCKMGETPAAYLPMVPELTENEVVDYYKKAMDYDTIVSKNLDVQEVEYEAVDIAEAKREKLVDLVSKVEGILALKEYPLEDYETIEFLNPNIYYYIKTFIDDKTLTGGTVTQAKEALGYYFLDVDYTISSATPGKFTDKAVFLGLNGAFKQLYTGEDTIDTAFLRRATKELNDYFLENRINQQVNYDPDTLSFKVEEVESLPVVNTPIIPEDTTDTNENSEENRTSNTPDDLIDENVNPEGEESPVDDEPIVPSREITTETITARTPLIDVKMFNSIVGSSLGNGAYVPRLDMVYEIPEPQGTMSGYCIFPSGDNSLKNYAGFSRADMEGTITLRYVFMDDILDPSKTIPINVYPVIWDITQGINTELDSLIPDFVETELKKIIERSDRAIINKDIAALMSGDIYTDMGKAVLVGFENKYVNVTKHMSTLRRVLARPKDENGKYLNTYLVEVETYRQEGPKGVGSLGTYKDTYYMSIEQVGTKFVISDSVLMNRMMEKEPAINNDDLIIKRLVALNLAGPVTEESKPEIKALLNNLYDASSARQMSTPEEPKTVTIGGQSRTITRGIRDCFNDEVSLLSSSRKSYLIAQLSEQLVKYGTDVNATYNGVVTSWMGAADRQAELTTEEVITYSGRNNGKYRKMYYLVSRMNDYWVIDEMKILEEEDKEGAELQQIVDRINNARG